MTEHEDHQFLMENWDRVRSLVASVVASPNRQTERRLILAELQALGPTAEWDVKNQLEYAEALFDSIKTPDGKCFVLWLALYAVTHIDHPPTEAEFMLIDQLIKKRTAEKN